MITNSLGQNIVSNERIWLDGNDVDIYSMHKSPTFYLWVVFHELLGHGTGKLLAEESPGKYNFDVQHPPVNPLTGRPIETWYRHGQTWTSLFGDLATTVDECRAECVGAYLLSEMDLLAIFGYDEETSIKGRDR